MSGLPAVAADFAGGAQWAVEPLLSVMASSSLDSMLEALYCPMRHGHDHHELVNINVSHCFHGKFPQSSVQLSLTANPIVRRGSDPSLCSRGPFFVLQGTTLFGKRGGAQFPRAVANNGRWILWGCNFRILELRSWDSR